MPKWIVGGVELPHGPYMIGAGACKTPANTKKWFQIAPVVSGSYTKLQRSGNEGLVVWPDTLDEFLEFGAGLNSYSMPNMGFAAAANELLGIESEHPLIVSVAGFSVSEYIDGVEIFSALDSVAAVELNFGCPNTQGDHPDIISFSPNVVSKIIESIVSKNLISKPIWLKFSPYSNPAELKRMAELVNGFARLLKLAVVTCNTFPNAYAGEERIDANNGMAGLSGSAMKCIALGQVRQFRQCLNSSVDVIGVGGITAGDDVIDFLEAGAQAVQLTSLAHWAGNPKTFFEHLMKEETASRFLQHLTDDI